MSDSKHVLIVYFAILLLIVVVLYGFASITPQEKTAFRCGTHSPHGYWLTEATAYPYEVYSHYLSGRESYSQEVNTKLIWLRMNDMDYQKHCVKR